MDYSKATNKQLWSIMKHDKECPLQSLEGVFQEALNRGIIKNAILRVIKQKDIPPEDDYIQIGYEGSLKALREFEPGRGSFIDILFIKISQALGMYFQKQGAKKRKGNTVSYQNTFLNGDKESIFEVFLMDRKTNIEKMVIDKMMLEEKLSVLTDEQRKIFDLFFMGYSIPEIAQIINYSRTRTQGRLQEAFVKMTGQKLDLRKLKVYERRYKKQGA